jgi:hypothetical protein
MPPVSQLDRIEGMCRLIVGGLTILMAEEVILLSLADDILASVQELPTIDDSLDALFQQLQVLITAGQAGDLAKLQQANDIVSTFKDRTKAAIVANTPAAPTA